MFNLSDYEDVDTRIIAFFYAGYNLAEHKYYEKGYKHGYNRAKPPIY